MASLQEICDRQLGEGQQTSSENVAYNCPFCVTRGRSADLHQKMYVNFQKRIPGARCPGVFFCHRCESTGSVERLLTFLGCPSVETLQTSQEWVSLLRSLFPTSSGHGAAVGLPVRSYVLDFRKELIDDYGAKPIEYQTPEYEYLRSRGLTDSTIAAYGILYSRKGKLRDRVIVPTYENDGSIPIYVARAIKTIWIKDEETGVSKELPKYLNSKNANRNHCVFNLTSAIYKAPLEDPILITEGVFSAIAAGPSAVATFGKSVSDSQVKRIVDSLKLCSRPRSKEVVVCLDGDAVRQTVSLAARFHQAGVQTSFIILPKEHDPESVGTKFLEYIQSRIRYDEMTVLKLRAMGLIKI